MRDTHFAKVCSSDKTYFLENISRTNVGRPMENISRTHAGRLINVIGDGMKVTKPFHTSFKWPAYVQTMHLHWVSKTQ